MEAHDARDRSHTEREEIERDLHPVAPRAFGQDDDTTGDLDRGRTRFAIEQDRERNAGGSAVLLERTRRAAERRVDATVELTHGHDATFVGDGARIGLGHVVRVLAVGRVDRGCHHPAEGPTLGSLDGEVRGHAPHVGRDAVIFQHAPERNARAIRFGVTTERELPSRGEWNRARRFRFHRRRDRQARHRIAVDEVEDAVPTGITTRDEVRPGDRRLRRHGRLELVDPVRAGDPHEVTHAVGKARDRFAQEIRVHPVDAQHDAACRGLRHGIASAREAGRRERTEHGEREPHDPARTFHALSHAGPDTAWMAPVGSFFGRDRDTWNQAADGWVI